MIIVGLGNIGPKYDNTRHNIGFMVVSKLCEKMGIVFKKVECQSMIAEGFLKGEKYAVAKPQTFMNLSGRAVKELMGKYKTPISEVVVISDDLDIPLGACRIRKSGGAGTHNGLKSIIEETGSKDFLRIRIGMGEKPHPDMDLADFVLSKFQKNEMNALNDGIDNAVEALIELLEGRSVELVMGSHNK